MSVFRNYDNREAGGVNANAFPRVHPIPWQPTQRNVRSNPNIPSQPQRIQPHERGATFPTSATSGGTLAPQMSSGCGGCGGCSGNGSQTVNAADVATRHAFPTNRIVPPISPRLMRRGTGIIRSGPLPSAGVRLAPGRGMGR